MPRQPRCAARRIWKQLWENDFTGGYAVVKDALGELMQKHQEVFVP